MYVIGDVHGDASRLVFLLTHHRLIAIDGGTVRWVARNVILLFMGDLVDAMSRNGAFGNMAFEGSLSDMWILEFIDSLAEQAPAMGNTVTCLLGNHEVMNLNGYFQYVSPYHMKNPQGRRQYFGPGGGGRAIIERRFQTTVTYNGVLYSHAGVPIDATPGQKRLVGKRVRGNFMNIVDGEDVEYFTSHREYMQDESKDLNFSIGRVCRRHGAERMVVGHNYTGEGVVSRYDGRVVFVDVGLSRSFSLREAPRIYEMLFDPGDGRLVVLRLDGSKASVPRI